MWTAEMERLFSAPHLTVQIRRGEEISAISKIVVMMALNNFPPLHLTSRQLTQLSRSRKNLVFIFLLSPSFLCYSLLLDLPSLLFSFNSLVLLCRKPKMSDFEDSQNKSNHSYGDNSSSSPPRVQKRVITLGGMGPIRSPSTRADKPKKKKAAKQGGGTPMTNSDLVDLRRRCQVPVEVHMILSRPPLHLENVSVGWCCAYANFFEKCGLFFPIPASRTKEVTLSQTELELLTLLRRGQTDWSTFSRDRIVAALAVAPAVPAIVPPTAQLDPIEEVPRIEPVPQADLPIIPPDSSSTSELPLIRRMRCPSLHVQRANAEAHARADDLSAAVTAARNTLAVSNASASASHPSLPEVNTGTSAAAVAIAATNKLVALYEQRLSQVPSASELEEGKTLIRELTSSVKAGQDREVSFQAEIERLKIELSTSKDLEKGYAEKIGFMEMEFGGLQADKQTARSQIHRLEQRREELSKKVMDLTSSAQGAKKAVHDAKVELAAAYLKLLAGIKEKWVTKKEYTVLEGQAAEVESNLALIDQITKAAIDLTLEKPRLQAELDDLEARCKSKEVSDFTLSKLDLPHVSEISVVRPIDVDEQGTPIGLDEFGSNKDAFPGGLADGSGTVFAMPAGESRE
ncbi:hypothetical protein [Arabidopsis thaliana]|uniref:T24H24.5 protein n=1 Tax=Arabidopsis thaliana TaxID=3702 RepID=O81434_ARATH|nr:contains similarity to Aplysia californica intermediate filament protein A (GB:X60297) [Arabidopsis thaliana]CAB77875.1 hypothetical protein [Arabidopsis thaliana]